MTYNGLKWILKACFFVDFVPILKHPPTQMWNFTQFFFEPFPNLHYENQKKTQVSHLEAHHYYSAVQSSNIYQG